MNMSKTIKITRCTLAAAALLLCASDVLSVDAIRVRMDRTEEQEAQHDDRNAYEAFI